MQLLLITLLAAGLVLLVLVSQRRRLGALTLPSRAAKPRLCPHLGLASDPFKHYPGANDEHRCYANMGRERVDLAQQRRYCLASCYSRCPFLTVKEKGRLERIWTWVRAVSPVPQAQPGVPRRFGGSPWASPALQRLGVRLLAFLREVYPLLGTLLTLVVERGLPLASAAVRRLALVCARAWPRPRPQFRVVPEAAALADIEPEVSPVRESAVRESPAAEPAVVDSAVVESSVVASSVVEAPIVASVVVGSEVHDAPVYAAIDDADSIEVGIRALEVGDEATAYKLFKRATHADPRDLRAWFWRAKTADTLDEVIDCLERALALEPTSTQIKANLDWAVQRREQTRLAKAASKARSKSKAASPLAPSRPSNAQQVRTLALEVTRCLTAVAAFGVGAAWLLSALPPELRLALAAATDLRVLQVPDAALVFAQLPLPTVGGGYPTASALPYGIGFLAEFVGFGLLSGQGWTRAWAPLVGLASAWLWFHAGAALPSDIVLLGCAVVASGGVLAFDSEPKVRPATA